MLPGSVLLFHLGFIILMIRFLAILLVVACVAVGGLWAGTLRQPWSRTWDGSANTYHLEAVKGRVSLVSFSRMAEEGGYREWRVPMWSVETALVMLALPTVWWARRGVMARRRRGFPVEGDGKGGG
jgi:hypothetical protein